MKISDGKIVRFTQTYHTRGHGEWGTFETEIKYPENLDPGMQEALAGLEKDDKTNVHLEILSRFVYDESLEVSVPKSQLKGADQIEIGMMFKARFNDRSLQGIVEQIDQDRVMINCNLPLMGLKNVYSQIQILDVRDPTEKEIQEGFSASIKVI